MDETETRKEKLIVCLVTGIAGACIATACFYAAGASFAVLFISKATAKSLMTAWKLWLEFYLLAFFVSVGYAYLVLFARLKLKNRNEVRNGDISASAETQCPPKEDSDILQAEELDDFVADFLERDIQSILEGEESLDDLLDGLTADEESEKMLEERRDDLSGCIEAGKRV